MSIDFSLAQEFLNTLCLPGTSGWTFQTFDDSSQKRSGLVRVINAPAFDGPVQTSLKNLNEAGAGVFVTVNQTDLKGRCESNVTALRALFVDADDVPWPDAFHATPDIMVYRSDRHWHAYWLLAPGSSLADFSMAQKRLSQWYNTDPKVNDIPRVMRVPGFAHQKTEKLNVSCQICHQGQRRTIATLMSGLPEYHSVKHIFTAVPAPHTDAEQLFMRWADTVAVDVVEGQRNTTLFKIACEGAGRGISQQTVRTFCLSRANGVSESEVNAIIKSAFTKARGNNLPADRHMATAATLTLTATETKRPGALDAILADAISGRRYAAAMPWVRLSKATRALLPGTVTILAGPPGSTKSFAMIQALRYWIQNNIPAVLLVLEYGVGPHVRRALAQIAGNSSITDDEWCKNNPQEVLKIRERARPLIDQIEQRVEVIPEQHKLTPENFVAWIGERAKENRVIAIDPITMMEKRKDPWVADSDFLNGAKKAIEKHGSSLFLISHPRKLQQGAQVTMDDLAGGAVYSRFSQTILYLRSIKPKEVYVSHEMGNSLETPNRIVRVFKANNGIGAEHSEYAMNFDTKTLSLVELGKVVED